MKRRTFLRSSAAAAAAVSLPFAERGTMLGEFTVPASVRIRAMDGWTFAAMARDSLDVESILVLRAVR